MEIRSKISSNKVIFITRLAFQTKSENFMSALYKCVDKDYYRVFKKILDFYRVPFHQGA